MASSTTKLSISALPLPPPTHILTHNLTPDPRTPSPSTFFSYILATTPSIQRRARLLDSSAHYSHVSPLPLPFPFEIRPPSPPAEEVEDKAEFIEQWLAAREARYPRPSNSPTPLTKYYPDPALRDQPRELIGLADNTLRDCLPHLDIGDAFDTLGVPSLSHEFDDVGDPTPHPPDSQAAAIRQELIDVLSGHAVLMSPDPDPGLEEKHVSFAPWSIRYSGHQFGIWAGQLGDGRAISIHVTPHPTDPSQTYELQLKGAGRTPFSRSADGLAVLRSSIREFLGSEAMQALRIPTTRALALISLPALPVQRERVENACVLTRVAPSFLRIGSFEAFAPPADVFSLGAPGGGGNSTNWEGLWRLGEWVARRVLGIREEKDWAREIVMEAAKRNAEMVAGWQAYGFMHGVINTDNVSLLGLTIDYGPYAFMDVFDPWHICNHTDQEGRYAYKYQPNMIVYALRALLRTLAPLIGAQRTSKKPLGPDWATKANDAKIFEWRVEGEEVKEEMERVVADVCSRRYGELMRKRLGLKRQDPTDESQITRPLLDILEEHKLDFHATFRALSFFRPVLPSASHIENESASGEGEGEKQTPLEKFIQGLLALSPESEAGRMDHAKATQDWLAWLEKYAARIGSERVEWPAGEVDAAREEAMRTVNPRFVLRQWVLEDVIARVERDVESGKRVLGKVLQMVCNPYEPWGAEGDARPDAELEAEVREERRFCGMGEKKMLGFQCSCSS